ncbi:MAG: nucleotidyltransferase family protein [Candidatus Omnitrophota bacterium]
MKVLILAAGYATRMYPLTKHWPKPLLLVKEKPIISHIVDNIKCLKGLNEIIVISNDKFYQHFVDWAKQININTKISILNDLSTSEDNRLGAIGDIYFALENCVINDDLLIIGGDNLFSFDLKDFVKFSQEKKDGCSIGLYDIKDYSMVKNYGVVTINPLSKVIDFKEKPRKSASTLISMCIYYFSRKSFKYIKEYVMHKDSLDTSGDYIKWLAKKNIVWGVELKGTWYDIGDIISFYHANMTYNIN